MSETFQPFVAKKRYHSEWDFSFYIGDETASSWYRGEDQYLPEWGWCQRHIKPGMTVVDAGAHHGIATVLFAHWVGPSGHVHAYEIVKKNADIVLRNLDLNRLECATVRPVGLSDHNGTIAVQFNEGNATSAQDGTALPVVRLDDDLPPGARVDLLKLDVEGSDLQALEGATRTLQARPHIALEVHNFTFSDREKTLASILKFVPFEHYTYQVVTDVIVEPEPVEAELNLRWLASIDNPRILCAAREKPLSQWRRWFGSFRRS